MRRGLWQTLTWPFRAGPRRPLSTRRPDARQSGPTPLGMEEVDMSLVNRVNRRNDALERASTFFVPTRLFQGVARNADISAAPLPDDETYAARYHRAYIEKKGSHPND